MRKRKVHLRDTRLFNNAGTFFPLCQSDAIYLDLDKCNWHITVHMEDVNCKKCLAKKRKEG